MSWRTLDASKGNAQGVLEGDRLETHFEQSWRAAKGLFLFALSSFMQTFSTSSILLLPHPALRESRGLQLTGLYHAQLSSRWFGHCP